MKIANVIKKSKKTMSGSLFFKIFFVCVFVSLFLIAFLGFYTHFYILRNLDQEIEKYERNKLNETLNNSITLFTEMEKLTMSYALNNKFAQFAYMPRDTSIKNYVDIQNNQEIMSNTVNSSNYIENIFVYYDRNNYVLDYSGPMDFSYYYDRGWYAYYEELTHPSIILDTRKVKKRHSSNSDSYNYIITFMVKIPYANIEKDGAVVLNVHASIVGDLLKNIADGDSHTLAFLVNDTGKILASNEESYTFGDITEIIDVPEHFYNLNEGNFKFDLDGTKMAAYFDTSPINNWKLLYVESENAIFHKSVYIRNITFILFASLLLLAALVSFLFSLKVYNPIKNIVTNIKNMTTLDNENISDISLINGGLNLLHENNKLLESQLKQNEILIRELFLSQLISGKLFNKNEIMSKAAYFSLNLNADFYKVAVIQINPVSTIPVDIQKLEYYKISAIHMVTHTFNSLNFDAICAQDSNDNILILIKLYSIADANETEAIIEQVLEDIAMAIENQHSISVSIGVGKMYSDLSNVGVSCKEAIEALRYKFLMDDHSVISILDITRSENDKLYYPIQHEQKLISFIQLSDYEKTLLCVHDMIDEIMNHNKNFKHIEMCLTNMTGLIQRYIYELNLNEQEIFGVDAVAGVSVESFSNIQNFTEWFTTRIRKIIDYQIEQQKDDSKSFVLEVKDYINKVYAEEISLDIVASHFNYNSSYFCKIFKEKIGTTFWEYVAKIRIEKSKELLIQLDDTIEHIAALVGYNNRFSFIRAFKKYTSITPGEYRMKLK